MRGIILWAADLPVCLGPVGQDLRVFTHILKESSPKWA